MITINEADKALSMGNYLNVWSDLKDIVLSKTEMDSNINEKLLLHFQTKLEKCRLIRNHCGHAGEIVTYQEQQEFIENLFEGNDCIVKVLIEMKKLLK